MAERLGAQRPRCPRARRAAGPRVGHRLPVLGRARLLVLALACLRCGLAAEDDALEAEMQEMEDAWSKLTTEDWQPGRVGAYNTTVPMKDLECEGPATAILHDSEVNWATVKAGLHAQLGNPFEEHFRWLFKAAGSIQKHESDACVLGITTTSAWLLPVTMPKIRNRARMLNTDHNLLIINVTFFESMRSGFPVFGVLDALASEEYCEWFASEESRLYFEAREEAPSCGSPAAEALRLAVAAGRAEPGDPAGWRAPLHLATALFSSGEAAGDEACAPAVGLALLVYALARLQAGLDGGDVGDEAYAHARAAVLRDLHELVSEAEERIRDYSWSQGVRFGELVASPFRVWFVLHQLQLKLLRFLGEEWDTKRRVYLPEPPDGGWAAHPPPRPEL